jgi:hypothetical protein
MADYKTLTIFDWDDTLFPTSWIVKNNINLNDKNMQNQYIVFFSRLDTLLYNLLNRLLKYSQIVIVTNAVIKWVIVSSNMLPNTQKILKDKILILSARDIFQDKYPNEMHMWKKKVFEKVVNDFFTNTMKQNIISVGDAEYEFNATTDLYNEHSVIKYRLLKTVRLMKDPSFEELIDQLDVLNNCIQKIVLSRQHFDLKFEGK